MNSEQFTIIEPLLREVLDWILEVQRYQPSWEEGWRSLERLESLTSEDICEVMRMDSLFFKAQMLMVCSDLNIEAFKKTNPNTPVTLEGLTEHWHKNSASHEWRERFRKYQASLSGSNAM